MSKEKDLKRLKRSAKRYTNAGYMGGERLEHIAREEHLEGQEDLQNE